MKANTQRKTDAHSSVNGNFLNADFLRRAKKELEKNGFVTDEHDFAPYRDALKEQCKEMERDLRKIGFKGHLMAGRLDNHPGAGYAYFVFDSDRLNSSEAEAAIWRWLDQKYQDESHA